MQMATGRSPFALIARTGYGWTLAIWVASVILVGAARAIGVGWPRSHAKHKQTRSRAHRGMKMPEWLEPIVFGWMGALGYVLAVRLYRKARA